MKKKFEKICKKFSKFFKTKILKNFFKKFEKNFFFNFIGKKFPHPGNFLRARLREKPIAGLAVVVNFGMDVMETNSLSEFFFP